MQPGRLAVETILVNGRVDQGIPGDDQGFTRGLSVFETMRSYGHSVFRLEPHLNRLRESALALGIEPDESVECLRREILHVAGNATNLCIRVSLTGSGNRVLHASSIQRERVGATVSVATVRMEPFPWLPGAVKHASRAAWVLAARAKGVDEVLFLDRKRNILEANRSNVFAVVDGKIRTPPCDGTNLEGVTRGALIEAARSNDLAIAISPLPLESDFSELYLSSTLKELAPVGTLDGESVGAGEIGGELLRGFHRIVSEECGVDLADLVH
jgi:branched-chain amino acid aminotransferase